MEHFLFQHYTRWVIRGARPEAEPLCRGTGWVLRLCGRARLAAWLNVALFGGALAAVVNMQLVAPQPRHIFLFEAITFGAITLLASYYLVFSYSYRVELDPEKLTLFRFLLPPRQIGWEDLTRFDFEPGDELLKLRSENLPQVSLYLSLHGLSAIRRCIAAYTPPGIIALSWITSDMVLLKHVPSWRCPDRALQGNPFDPLGAV